MATNNNKGTQWGFLVASLALDLFTSMSPNFCHLILRAEEDKRLSKGCCAVLPYAIGVIGTLLMAGFGIEDDAELFKVPLKVIAPVVSTLFFEVSSKFNHYEVEAHKEKQEGHDISVEGCC